jgi:PAS domain S-box-containing protein
MPVPPQTSVPLIDAGLDEADLQRVLVAAVRQDDLRAVFLLSPDGRICWANPAALRMFGYAADALLGRPVDVLFLPGDVERDVPGKELEAARVTTHSENDRWMKRADGSAFWATGATISIRDEADALRGFMKLLRNRTDLREQTRALRSVREALSSHRDRITETIAKFAHELRSPLSVVSNAAVVMQKLAGQQDPRVEESLRLVRRQCEHMARLTDELLHAVHAGDSPRPVERTRVLVQAAIADAIAAVVGDTADRERISVLLPPCDVVLVVDRTHLHQMLVNLIENAVKYTPAPGPVCVRLSVEGDEAVVRVEDRGVGIAPEMLAGIFELFTRATHDAAVPGAGIGLAVVKELVTLNGGAVLAQSDGPGRGAKFTLRLPLVREQATARHEARLMAGADVPASGRVRAD